MPERKLRAGQFVETQWAGRKHKLYKIGNGSLAIKIHIPCYVCGGNDHLACVQPGGAGGWSYVVDFKTGKYLANLRDEVYVCKDPACQEKYSGKKPKEYSESTKKIVAGALP